jgi:hypothetical protein
LIESIAGYEWQGRVFCEFGWILVMQRAPQVFDGIFCGDNFGIPAYSTDTEI